MIKEKQIITKYNFKKTKKQIFVEYIRTIGVSFLVALFITSILTFNARQEMIKNLTVNESEQNKLDKQLALQIITQTNLLKDLKKKSYSVCMHVGELYETAGDYYDAQKAYELAIEKANSNAYRPYSKLVTVLVAQDKFDKAKAILESISDESTIDLIKFKTRAYITIGDKYYSNGKFLSAAKNYEKADFYYSKFSKKDSVVEESIIFRIINSYIKVADIMVKTGLNSDAVRFLKKAEQYSPQDFNIRYKLAIVLSDLDPEKSVAYFESLLEEKPQNIDYGIYGSALMKSATIADLDGRPTKAKYYRYKIHSVDLFVNRKVVYKNDIETDLVSFSMKKEFFNYPLKAVYSFFNVSNVDIINLKAEFVLLDKNKPLESITMQISDKTKPLLCSNLTPNNVEIKFKKKIFTKKELENYTIKIYLFKDEKYKTLVFENKIPEKSF